jgi:hypothetical protein
LIIRRRHHETPVEAHAEEYHGRPPAPRQRPCAQPHEPRRIGQPIDHLGPRCSSDIISRQLRQCRRGGSDLRGSFESLAQCRGARPRGEGQSHQAQCAEDQEVRAGAGAGRARLHRTSARGRPRHPLRLTARWHATPSGAAFSSSPEPAHRPLPTTAPTVLNRYFLLPGGFRKPSQHLVRRVSVKDLFPPQGPASGSLRNQRLKWHSRTTDRFGSI